MRDKYLKYRPDAIQVGELLFLFLGLYSVVRGDYAVASWDVGMALYGKLLRDDLVK